MSVKVMNLVWQAEQITDLSQMAVLLALADWSNDSGLSWPSIPVLARKARQSERNVRYVIRDLQTADILTVVENRGRNRSNHYMINLQRLQVLSCGQPVDNPVDNGTENLQTTPGKPATCDSKTCNAIERARAGSVIDTSKAEPSEENPPRKALNIARQKAEAAWEEFDKAVGVHIAKGTRLTIRDPIANKVFHEIGGWRVREDYVSVKDSLKDVFVSLYAQKEHERFKEKSGEGGKR